MEMAPKEREALVNRGLLALVALTDIFKASTELAKSATSYLNKASATLDVVSATTRKISEEQDRNRRQN